MSAAKKQRTTRAEQEKLLEEFYENLGNETFLGYAFIGEGEDLGEPDSSSDEDYDEESIANEEEFEKKLQEADFETLEAMMWMKKRWKKVFCSNKNSKIWMK